VAGERDWTNRAFDAGSGDSSGQERRLVAGMGAPLESGNNYYVGIYNDSANAAGYTIESLGIGSGQTFPVRTRWTMRQAAALRSATSLRARQSTTR